MIRRIAAAAILTLLAAAILAGAAALNLAAWAHAGPNNGYAAPAAVIDATALTVATVLLVIWAIDTLGL